MIRVRLTDPGNRADVAAFLRFSNLVVTFPKGEDTLDVDFAAFDLADDVQLRIVTLMLGAWNRKHRNAYHTVAGVTIIHGYR